MAESEGEFYDFWNDDPPQLPLLLMPPPKGFEGPVIYRKNSALITCGSFERAGRAYEERLLGRSVKLGKQEEQESKDEASGGKLEGEGTIWKFRKKVRLDDYYGLLGLDEKNVMATEDEIKKAYRAMSKLCHPDKADPKDREKAEERFKAMQRAYETLSDPTRRRVYDSSLPFDDSIPDDDEGTTEETFFKVYGPVFKRNARFSTIQPVPELGDMNTPLDKVNEFYDFWTNFKSWRDPPHPDEHKINPDDPREEKRRLERENQKLRAAARKAEIQRIHRLVDGAIKKDPRLQRAMKEEEERKRKLKEERRQRRLQQEAEEARRRAEEEARLEAERRAKEEEEKRLRQQKEELKNMRKRLRRIARSGVLGDALKEDDVELVCEKLDYERFSDLLSVFPGPAPGGGPNDEEKWTEAQKEAAKSRFLQEVARLREAEEQLRKEQEARLAAQREKEEKEKAAMTEWTIEEISALAKASAKYPQGTKDRWELITATVNAQGGGKKTVKEVMRKFKEAQLTSAQMGIKQEDAFVLYMQKVARAKEKVELEEQVRRMAKAGVKDVPVVEAAAVAAKVTAEAVKSAPPPPPTEREIAVDKPKKPALDPNEWTAAQQAAFEQALRSVPKDAPDRWDQIASRVPGKTKEQCIQRFNQIREAILKQKAAQAAAAAGPAAKAKLVPAGAAAPKAAAKAVTKKR